MQLVRISVDSLRLSQPLKCRLRDETGQLLLERGAMIESARERELLASRGLFVDVEESEEWRRMAMNQLHGMVRRNLTLGEIANALLHDTTDAAAGPKARGAADFWADQRMAVSLLLHREPTPGAWLDGFEAVARRMIEQWTRQPRQAGVALMHDAVRDGHDYCARHACACAWMCWTASGVLGLDEPVRASLVRAALSMNIGMAALQDRLAVQADPPTPAQRASIDAHAEVGRVQLIAAGVLDPLWLAWVQRHHDLQAWDTRQSEDVALQLLQATDGFVAQLSPRASRDSLPSKVAVRNALLRNGSTLGTAAAALLKAVGLFPPGTYVALANGETALVLEPGAAVDQPQVLVVQRRDGAAVAERVLRDTALPAHRITAHLPFSAVKVRIDLSRTLAQV